jgi:hypothetical protein
MKDKILIRYPVAPIGVIVHKPKKGKGGYTRKAKHRNKEGGCFPGTIS